VETPVALRADIHEPVGVNDPPTGLDVSALVLRHDRCETFVTDSPEGPL